MLIDSHCHLNMLDLGPYEGKMQGVLDAAKKLGVERFLCVAVDLAHHDELTSLAEAHDDVWISVGIHPNERETTTPDTIIEMAAHPKVIAIGETGLDYFRTADEDIQAQQENFRLHIDVAKKLNKPLIIHTRDAREDTIRIMQEENAQACGGVLHCFTESLEMAKAAIDMGFYISFSGIVTFKNAKALQAVAEVLPLDRILVETDSPYLTPAPYRGKPNYPGYTHYVAEYIATLKGLSYERVAEQTTKNFCTLFKVSL